MAVIEVTSVESDRLHGALVDAQIEAPVEGTREDVHVLRLAGWVLARTSPPATVEVRVNGRLVQTARFTIPRPDVAERGGGEAVAAACHGYDFEVGTLGLGEAMELRLTVFLEDGTRARLGWVRGRREPLRSGFEPVMQPLMVTSPGRSGTTLLMAMLAAHPGIVVHGGYPFEYWPAKYWMLALKHLTDPADHERSMRAMWLDGDIFHLGRNPFHLPGDFRNPALRDWLGREQPERMAVFAQEAIERWYRAIASEQGLRHPPYFAEKQMDPLSLGRSVMREIYPDCREIFIVRDFRDMAHSRIRFLNSKRIDRGKQPDEDPQKLLEFVRTDFKKMLGQFAGAWREAGERSHLVRYEDMVLEPQPTLAALLDYLQLDASPETVEAMIAAPAIPDKHRTSADPASSVGRWRSDGDEQFRAVCQEELGDLLVEFGYSRT